MYTIFCNNVHLDINGRKYPCNRYLADVPDDFEAYLKEDESRVLTLRCAKCPKGQRWISIQCIGGKLSFVSSGDRLSRNPPLKFDDMEIVEQVA